MTISEQEQLSNAYSGLKDKYVQLKGRHRYVIAELKAAVSDITELRNQHTLVKDQLEAAASEIAQLKLMLLRSKEKIESLDRGVAENLHIAKCEAVLSAHNLLDKVKAYSSKRYVNQSRYDRVKKERDFYKSLVGRDDQKYYAALKSGKADLPQPHV